MPDQKPTVWRHGDLFFPPFHPPSNSPSGTLEEKEEEKGKKITP